MQLRSSRIDNKPEIIISKKNSFLGEHQEGLFAKRNKNRNGFKVELKKQNNQFNSNSSIDNYLLLNKKRNRKNIQRSSYVDEIKDRNKNQNESKKENKCGNYILRYLQTIFYLLIFSN